ncbi:LlaJI family restriction endonuclease [Acinetobacter bereziniae]|uniref:LlaJI family restriction endonuclease n=1 Tax=Acinetobacter bereziniae TaxID=106648 RepID=UPI003213BEA6
MKNEIHFFHDRQPIATLPKELKQLLLEKGLVYGEIVQKVSFCGMFRVKSAIYLFLPRSTKINCSTYKDKVNLASLLMQAIERYGKISKNQVALSEDGDESIGLYQLNLMRELVGDYLNHGIYKRRYQSLKKNNGKTDWHKTINSSVAFPNEKKQPVYLDLYGKKSYSSYDSEISKIHAQIIRDIFENYAWLLGVNTSTQYIDVENIPKNYSENEIKISLLHLELRNLYSDRDILLIQNLIKFIEQTSAQNPSQFIAGLTRFHFAWEHMLGKIFKNKLNINNKLPIPVYIDHDLNPMIAYQNSMRTDLVLKDDASEKIIIIDAKYYQANSITTSPGWSDLVKQFFYEKSINTIFSGYSIVNLFIFPGSNGKFKEVKMQDRDDKSKYLDNEFPPIQCVYLDPIFVLNHYVNLKMIDYTKILKCSIGQTFVGFEEL